MRRVLVVLMGCVAIVSSGCGGGGFSVRLGDSRPRRTVVRIDDGHICSNLCHDHYWNGSRVVVLSGHRHHANCGHSFAGGHWITFREHGDHVDVVDAHRCDHNCHHHYWDGGRLVALSGHRHGPGCGHDFHDGHWALSVSLGGGHIRFGASHVCGSRCHDHYWDGSRHVVLTGHRHRAGCGHVFSKNRWVVGKSRAHKGRVVTPKKARVVVKPHKARVTKERAVKGKAASKKARVKKGKSKKSKSYRNDQ